MMYTVNSFLAISMFLESSFETECLVIFLNSHTLLSRKSTETFESRDMGDHSFLSFLQISKVPAAGTSTSPAN